MCKACPACIEGTYVYTIMPHHLEHIDYCRECKKANLISFIDSYLTHIDLIMQLYAHAIDIILYMYMYYEIKDHTRLGLRCRVLYHWT